MRSVDKPADPRAEAPRRHEPALVATAEGSVLRGSEPALLGLRPATQGTAPCRTLRARFCSYISASALANRASMLSGCDESYSVPPTLADSRKRKSDPWATGGPVPRYAPSKIRARPRPRYRSTRERRSRYESRPDRRCARARKRSRAADHRATSRLSQQVSAAHFARRIPSARFPLAARRQRRLALRTL